MAWTSASIRREPNLTSNPPFFQALRAAPDDLATWMAWSDWLEEGGLSDVSRSVRLFMDFYLYGRRRIYPSSFFSPHYMRVLDTAIFLITGQHAQWRNFSAAWVKPAAYLTRPKYRAATRWAHRDMIEDREDVSGDPVRAVVLNYRLWASAVRCMGRLYLTARLGGPADLDQRLAIVRHRDLQELQRIEERARGRRHGHLGERLQKRIEWWLLPEWRVLPDDFWDLKV